MSIFVKCNICLPQGCKSCPFNYTDVCIASNRGIDTRAFVHIRHPDCPLVALPTPHGRLIDADAYQYSGDLIDEPTIIEAEVSDERL